MNAEALHDELRSIRDTLDKDHAVRLHRAISWLKCAEKHVEDEDIAFISLWISFNSCYAIEDMDPALNERFGFNDFAKKLISLDNSNLIYNLLWTKYSQFVKALIANQYVFLPYWKSTKQGTDDWIKPFEASKKLALHALANNDTKLLLSIMLDRLYVLRNQILHGGATYGSQLNRGQVRDGKNMLSELLPIIIEIMFTGDEWGHIHFPVTDD